jgi:cell division cycle protein 37
VITANIPLANVDKRSFINAKRRQIHEQRHLRKQQIGHYKTEIALNEHLINLLDNLASILAGHSSEPSEDLVMHALIQLTTIDHSDVPLPPAGTPSYTQMMASLVDTIKKEIGDEEPGDRWRAFIERLKEHEERLAQQTKDTRKRLRDLENEEKAKITSDDVHEGFSSGHINKEQDQKPALKKPTTQKVEAVVHLSDSPRILSLSGDQSVSSGAEADCEDVLVGHDDSTQHIEPSALGRKFAQISIGEYRQCLQFISENPDVVCEKETDGLLIDAFNSQMAGKEVYARQCVHQALLLQYCRQLGGDGVSLFFKRWAVFTKFISSLVLLIWVVVFLPRVTKLRRFSMMMFTRHILASANVRKR